MSDFWALSGHDNRSTFLNEDSLSPKDVCPECGLLTNHQFKPQKLAGFRSFGRDVTATYDNRIVLSERLAGFFRAKFASDVDLLALPAGKELGYVPIPRLVAPVIETRSTIRRGDLCDVCCQYEFEMMPNPLQVDARALKADAMIFRTSIAFGDRLEKYPILVVRDSAKAEIEACGFVGLEWEAVET